MPYARPTLTQLRAMALQDISSANLPGVDGLLRRAVLAVLSWAIAGMAYLHYGYQDWIAREAAPWSATDEWAAGWGALKGVQRKAATAAVLTASFPGGVAGTDVPVGTAVTRHDGAGYTTTVDATINSSGFALLTLQAVTAGTAANCMTGTSLTLAGLSGVGTTGTVTGTITTGADIETADEYKTRYLQVYASPPAGGSQSDYVEWAAAVAGVTRSWCNPNGAGDGTVVVYTMWDDAEAAYGGFPQGTNGVAANETRDTPATGDQLTVANAIYSLRPATALVYSCAPIAQPINFVLVDVSPDTGAILSAIEAALTDMFLRIGSPLGMTVYPSDWSGAIDSVVGLSRYAIIGPAAPVTVPVGYLPTLGTVTASG